jgi:hypothetical protein
MANNYPAQAVSPHRLGLLFNGVSGLFSPCPIKKEGKLSFNLNVIDFWWSIDY